MSNKDIAERKIKNIVEKSKFNIKAIICYFDTEDIFVFEAIIRMCGIGMPISYFNPEDEASKECIYDLHQLCYDFAEYKKGSIKDIIAKTVEAEKSLLKHGVAVLPVTIHELTDDKTQNNYSPYILEPYFCKENTLEDIATKCQKTYFEKTEEKYSPIYIVTENEIKEEDLYELYGVMVEIIEIYNDYVKKKFPLKNKDKKHI